MFKLFYTPGILITILEGLIYLIFNPLKKIAIQ